MDKVLPMNAVIQLELSDPRVPEARDIGQGHLAGGLGYHAVQDGTQVEVLPYVGMIPGDRVHLYVGDMNTPLETRPVDEENQNKIITFNIPRNRLTDGEVQIRYTVSLIGSPDNEIPSQIYTLLIKTAIPGGLDPVSGTPWNENLSQVWLTDELLEGGIGDAEAAGGVLIVIDRYQNMSAGDTLYFRWGGAEKPVPITEDMVNKSIRLILDEDFIVQGGNGNAISVTYEITDIVGNRSLEAPYQYVSVALGGGMLLSPPRIRESLNGELNHDALNGGEAHVDIEVFSPVFELQDEVNIVWTSIPTEGAPQEARTHFAVTRLPATLTLDVDNSLVGEALENRGVASYTLTKKSNSQTLRSRNQIVRVVAAGADDLPAPVIDEASGVVLEPLNALSSLTAVIPALTNIPSGATVTVFWIGHNSAASYTTPPLSLNPAAPTRISLPVEMVPRNFNKTVSVNYQIEHNGSIKPSQKLALHVNPLTDKELQAPVLLEANNGVLDVNAMTKDGTLRVAPWYFIAQGQRIWLRYSGKDKSGNPVSYSRWENRPVTPAEISAGLTDPDVDLQWLRQLEDRSALNVELKINFSQEGNEADTLLFPPYSVTVLNVDVPEIPTLRPIAVEATGNNGTLLRQSDYYNLDNLTVTVSVYRGMTKGDVVNVRWEGRSASYEPPSQTVNSVAPLSFLIPRSEFIDNIGDSAQLTFTVLRQGRPPAEQSATLNLQIEAQSLLLAAPTLNASQTQIIVRYSGMTTAHVIKAYWVGVTSRSTNEISGSGSGEVTFPIPLNWITENLGRTVLIHYAVATGNGVSYQFSRVLRVAIQGDGHDDIVNLKPWAVEATGNNGTLLQQSDYYDLDKLTVEVPQYRNMAPNDTIVTHWVGRAHSFDTAIKTVITPGALRFDIPRIEFIDTIGHSAQLNFTVRRAGVPPTETSATLNLQVEGQTLNLPAPTLDNAQSTITVSYPSMVTSHQVRVRWVGMNSYDTAPVPGDVSGTVSFPVPASWINENLGQDVYINYAVIPSLGAQFQFSRILRVKIKADDHDDIASLKPVALEAGGNNGTLLRQTDYYRLENLTIQVPQYRNMAATDTVQVQWKGRAEAYNTVIKLVVTPGPMIFQIPRVEFIDTIGHTAQLTFTVRREGLPPSEFSAPLNLQVEDQSLQLPVPTLNSAQTQITVRYPAMASAHRIKVRWIGKTTYETSEVAGSTSGQVLFTVPSAWVNENVGHEVLINYTVAPAPGQQYQFSELLREVIKGDGYEDIPVLHPVSLDATGNNGTLLKQTDYYRLENLTAQVPVYRGMESGDTVGVRWIGRVKTFDTPIQTVSAVTPLKFLIPRPEFIDTIGGPAQLSFSVRRGGQLPTIFSSVVSLQVEGQQLLLPAPTLNGQQTRATITYAGMNSANWVKLRWIGVATHETSDLQASNTGTLNVAIPASWVTENRGKEVLINYAVALKGGDQYQFSRLLRLIIT